MRACQGALIYREPVEGTPFGRYQLIELLGRGGMGEVWRAHDTTIDRTVALKMLLPHYATDPEFDKRFRREARAAARLDDPHVVPIYDVGEHDGRLYVTMRLINGVDLATLLADGPLDTKRAVNIVEQIASALHSAHQAGLVHRDVKPSNILLGDNDFAYLIDFGIAHATGDTALTSANTTIGTWAYMAPERFKTGASAPSSDIYALTCVLYQCLTGELPFPGNTLEQVAVSHMVMPPPRPSEDADTVPTAMDQVIATGLAKQPTERYPSAVELAAAARHAITSPIKRNGPGPAAPPDPAYAQPWHPPPQFGAPAAPPEGTRRGGRRRGVLIGALAGVAVLIAGSVFAAVNLFGRDDPEATESSSSAAASPNTAPTPNTGPFTGVYSATFSPTTTLDPNPNVGPGPTPSMSTYAVRSVCRPTGCVATASQTSGDATFATTIEFDEANGSWVAVTLKSDVCRDEPAESWQVFTLQPRPDGTLTGEWTTTASNSCGSKSTVTFTRTGDVDLASLPDPVTLPPRVVSPAEALRGRYHHARAFTNGQKQESDYAVRTDCLRTGDRCMSFFHGATGIVLPMVFGDGTWNMNTAADGTCRGGAIQVTKSGTYPLPAPPQNPIALLTGRGRQDQTAPCAATVEFDDAFTRTGD